MTQTRNDFQVKATLDGIDLCEKYPSDRQSITVLKIRFSVYTEPEITVEYFTELEEIEGT